MRLPSLPVSLKRGVGRRILGFFLLAGILPVAFTAGLAWFEMGRGLEQDVGKSLRASAKEYGIDMLGRLQQASDAAVAISDIVEEGGSLDGAGTAYLVDAFEAIWLLEEGDQPVLIHGSGESSSDVASGFDSQSGTSATRLIFDSSEHGAGISLLRQVTGDARSFLVLRLRGEFLWGADDDLPYPTNYCVFMSTGEPLHCTQEMDRQIFTDLRNLEHRGSALSGEWRDAAGIQTASMWELFLAGEFGAPALHIAASQPKSYALQSRTDFSRVFIPALALVVILVGLLSFNMIGESLYPLQRLTVAARQIASGNLQSRVRIRSRDEFEWLGEAFNNMAGQLERQISTLEAVSDIDRMILSGASFEDVSETVIAHVKGLTRCDAAAVIARDNDTPHWAKMISSADTEPLHERIALPLELGNQWCQPRQVALEEVDASVAPYKERFLGYGVNHVALIPVVTKEKLNGILLLGSESHFNLQQDGLRRCIDLAGRFAVALSSVEREEVLYRQAHFDELTGLPNRQLLKDRLRQQLVHARRESVGGAMLFLDLDRFKQINDVYGHSVGDDVLAQAADRIVGEVRDSDTVARLGGDEFVVVLPRVNGDNWVRATASRLLDRLSESFSVRGVDHFLGASIGIVIFPEDGDSVEMLLKNADAAMYRAKEAGRARFEFFSRSLNAASRRKISLERDLRMAYHDGELEVYYQPQFDIATGVISGAEALLRWQHNDQGFIAPKEFIPLAEDSSLIVDIGRWVVEQTCRDLRRVLEEGLHPGPVSINVSGRQLREDAFVSDVLEPLHRHDIHPGYLQLEVTETTVAENRDTAIDILNALRAEGVGVAIDDFGTGYSSLSYLQQMPFDVIKIDKSFVDKIGAGDASDNICRTIIKMASELGKRSIAEGVETQEQLDFLIKNGCNFVQGFYYSVPLCGDSFVEFIRKQDFHTQRRKALEIVKA
jgi:diguanylate cyclase (GGDEF)-like protein